MQQSLLKLLVVDPRRGLSDAAAPTALDADALGILAGARAMLHNRAAVHLVAAVTLTSTIGYGQTAFGPSFMQRSLGLSLMDIATWIAPIAAVMGTASALLGGWMANVAARRYGVHAQAWLVLALKAVGLPLSFLFYASTDVEIAIPAYFVSTLLISSYLGPTFALIQGQAPLRARAIWAAITLFVLNLLGLGLGPTLIGVISDAFRPSVGEDSLRYAMLVFAAVTPWAMYHYWRAGVCLQRQTR